MSEEKQYRTVPTSNLDFNLMLTETLWGSNMVNPELKTLLTKEHQLKNEEGELLYDAETGAPLLEEGAYWETLSYYTRDLRLGNLTGAEVERLSVWLDLAGDFLKEGHHKAFVTALGRGVTIIEVSQSRKGFLRKMLNTIISKETRGVFDVEKKRFGGKKEAEY